MGTTTYTQPFKQGFAHAPTTSTTTAPAVSKPWYASLDSLPESGKFDGGNIDIPSQHCTSYDHQPKSSPQAQMRTRRFSNAEIERVIEEELEIADDIPAPWPLEFEEASPPNSREGRGMVYGFFLSFWYCCRSSCPGWCIGWGRTGTGKWSKGIRWG
ncbi:hypothetical protein D0864_12393 [Hortaea werneckii]|uniref:Uncharacterized protein n=1 Tax=Hortaea werneckii TaxID=91943 RepID=A0A3M7DJ92_HORWE|nr:hypothetical protein D0864_12393 [Hortaea werneckii]